MASPDTSPAGGTTCPPLEMIGLFASGGLTTAERERFAGHLERCPTCREELRHWQDDEKIGSLLREVQQDADARARIIDLATTTLPSS